ncbi:hypothetical protein [Streptomyces sp. NPDC088348]|uniref:hypothetical protein n=1 Tax=Streptomyces sp. NPDC088348 TaxID=3365853 RepID=UPI003803B8CE
MPADNEEFDRIVEGFTMYNPSETIDQNPYGNGPAVYSQKPGLTKRGKAALGIGAAVLAGGGLIGYQVHSASVAASDAKAQEIALKSQTLELEKLREINRANDADRKAAASQEKTRQASIDSCVKTDTAAASKGLRLSSHQDVINDCQAQYPSEAGTGDMAAAASEKDAASSGGGGSNQGLLLGGAVLAVGLVVAAKKGTRHNAA